MSELSPVTIRALAVARFQCPNCKAAKEELCKPHGDPRKIVCSERYTRAKNAAKKGSI
jgi:hypothetical protein